MHSLKCLRLMITPNVAMGALTRSRRHKTAIFRSSVLDQNAFFAEAVTRLFLAETLPFFFCFFTKTRI